MLALKTPLLRPCTPKGMITLLDYYAITLKSKHIVIVGDSTIVGRPMALECLLRKATVTVCHQSTINLAKHIQQADIIISATGKKGIIDPGWLAHNPILIDVGIHRDQQGKLTGDIDFDTCKNRTSWITPVPGGIGPMTIFSLMENTVMAAFNIHDLQW